MIHWFFTFFKTWNKEVAFRVSFTGLITAFVLYATFFDYIYEEEFKHLNIAIQPLGEVEESSLLAVKNGIETQFGAHVEILPVSELPSHYQHPTTKRYRVPYLTEHLKTLRPNHSTHILGITDKEISARYFLIEDYGIAGAANRFSREGVISTALLKPGSKDVEHLKERLIKLSLHELGHLLGMRHCSNSRHCVMSDAESRISKLEEIESEFCSKCHMKIKSIVKISE